MRRLLTAFCSTLTLILALTACGSEGSGGAGGSGGSDAHEQLLGTWVFDPELYKESPSFKAMPAEAQDMFLEKLSMEVIFTKTDCRMVTDMMGNKSDVERPYTIAEESGNTLTLEATDDNGLPKHFQVTVDGDRLSLLDGEKSFPLKRQ